MMLIFYPIVVVALGIATLSGFEGASIEKLDVPVAIHNGSGPIELICVYNIDTYENGLVVKWYHDGEQIYQWIPPMTPQDLGVIAGFASYPPATTNRPQSHSIIHLKEVTQDMSGEYTCSVTTFVSQDVSEMRRMIVYVPEKNLTVNAVDFNETHVTISCSAIGAHPPPELTIIVDSTAIKDHRIQPYVDHPGQSQTSFTVVTRKPAEPTVVQCQIQIPGTGYGRREKIVYYPEELRDSTVELINGALRLTSGATNCTIAQSLAITFALVFYSLRLRCNNVALIIY